jgi:serine protease inhibitor ecotin
MRSLVELQKQTEEGTLKVEILKDDEVIANSETTAPYGVVSVATE